MLTEEHLQRAELLPGGRRRHRHLVVCAQLGGCGTDMRRIDVLHVDVGLHSLSRGCPRWCDWVRDDLMLPYFRGETSLLRYFFRDSMLPR